MERRMEGWQLNADPHEQHNFLNTAHGHEHKHTQSSSHSAPQAHGETNRFNLAAVPVMSE